MKNIIFGLLILGFSSSALAARKVSVICLTDSGSRVVANCQVNAANKSIFCANSGFGSSEREYVTFQSVGKNRFDIEKEIVFFESDLLKKQSVTLPVAKGVPCRVRGY